MQTIMPITRNNPNFHQFTGDIFNWARIIFVTAKMMRELTTLSGVKINNLPKSLKDDNKKSRLIIRITNKKNLRLLEIFHENVWIIPAAIPPTVPPMTPKAGTVPKPQ